MKSGEGGFGPGGSGRYIHGKIFDPIGFKTKGLVEGWLIAKQKDQRVEEQRSSCGTVGD